jgi:RHS repeat-associated protein
VYNESGQLDTLVDLAGGKTRAAYDDERLPEGIVLPTAPTPLTITRNFPATHKPSQITYSDASVNTAIGRYYGYDLFGLVSERVNGNQSAGMEYVHDTTGRLKEIKEYILTGQPQCIDDDGSGLNCPPNGKVYGTTTTFSYDRVGNRTDQSAVADSGNRLRRFGGDSLLYDADGNVVRRWRIADSTIFNQRLMWNALDELDSVKTTRSGVTTVARFGYDGAGRRVRKVVGSMTSNYLWDGDDLLAELDGSGNRVAEYAYYEGIDRPHSVRRGGSGGSMYFYATDFPGNVNALIDASGAIVRQYEYTAFGEPTSVSGTLANALKFAAREHDEESGLYYVRARYYDPAIGRFISEDPIGLEGGINTYAYANNSPTNAGDPTGLATYFCVYWANSKGEIVSIIWCAPLYTNGGGEGRQRPEGGGGGGSGRARRRIDCPAHMPAKDCQAFSKAITDLLQLVFDLENPPHTVSMCVEAGVKAMNHLQKGQLGFTPNIRRLRGGNEFVNPESNNIWIDTDLRDTPDSRLLPGTVAHATWHVYPLGGNPVNRDENRDEATATLFGAACNIFITG